MSRCKNYGDASYPGDCLGTPDARFTMDFSDIGEGPIYWCANCGFEAHAVDAVLQSALKTKDGFAEKFEGALRSREYT